MSPLSSCIVVLTFTEYSPALVGFPEIVPFAGSIDNPSGRPSASYIPFFWGFGFFIEKSSYLDATRLDILTTKESTAINSLSFPFLSTL